jgi:hypothetical protein
LQEILTRTDAVEKAYHTEKASLQKLQEKTKALMVHNSLEDDLAQLHRQSEQIAAKIEEFEDWKQQFDEAQDRRSKESEKKMKKQFEKHKEKIDEKFQQMSAKIESNQGSILNALTSRNATVQEQISQLARSVKTLNSSLIATNNLVDTIKSSTEDEYAFTAKRAKHDVGAFDYDDEMIDLGTPHKRDDPPSSASSRNGGRSAD